MMIRFLLLWTLMGAVLVQAQESPQLFPKDSVVLVRTKTSLPYLLYGLGEDRLGGAKMEYLDSLVLLKITGVYKDLYRIKLTESLHAWIPQQLTQRDSIIKKIPYSYLTSSWRVYGDERHDFLSVSLPERLPYRSWQETDPSRIVVELFGATTNTNWITQLTSAKEISQVDYEQLADDYLRINIRLRHRQHWGYAIRYEGRRLVVSVKHQPSRLKLNALTIALDAGHGGSNLGARGLRSKVWEKDLNLRIVLALKKELERKGATVILTRDKDTLIGNNDRLLRLRALKPDLLISVHNNAAADTVKVRGTSTYYKHVGFRPLSEHILRRLLSLGVAEYGLVGRFNFTLNAPTEYPNVLVEGLFMSQPDDEALLLNPTFQAKMARQIRRGVEDWLKRVGKKT
ncbi:MAG: N-acetylmuramoyl-L-alanine amidase [Runella sp.]